MTKAKTLDGLERELRGKMPLRASLLLFTLVGLLATLIVWLILAKLDDVTRAPGKVVPAATIQHVQASQEGIITRVLVGEGQEVAAGDALVELDTLLQSSQLDRERLRAFALQAKIARLNAEISDKTPDFGAMAHEGAMAQIIASERALHLGRAQDLAGTIAILDQRLAQREQELTQTSSLIATITQKQAISREERDLLEPLVHQKIEPQTTLLRLRLNEEQLAGDLVEAVAQEAKAQAAKVEVQRQIANTRETFRAESLADLAEATAELAALTPSLPALEELTARAVLRAPVRGVINKINRQTLGGAVRQGEDLVEIVPLDDNLHVEAYLNPRDIAFLQPDQPARVKLTAYDFTRYGALDGKILRIGANAVQLSPQNDNEIFVITLQTSGTLSDADGRPVRIIPGMTAEVDILAGQRRVIDYLIQPIRRVAARAFTE